MIGKTLQHFRITGRLGRGGMGEVYAADDLELDRRVALKILPPGVAEDAVRRARFEREARAIATLNHPNIVTIHSVGESGGVHFLTMELVEGENLGHHVPAEGVELPRLLDIAVQLTDAIATAHDRGIIHRDLKPDNVMITPQGRVKVLDFGLAKLARPESPAPGGDSQAPTVMATQEGRILGTVAYMSPEQAEGRPADPRSDVFSLGIMLYEMATGRRPFSGETPMATLSSIIKDTPVPIGDHNAALPRELGRIIERCLAKDPSERYATAAGLRDDLARLGAAAETLRPSTGSRWWAGVAAAGLVAMAAMWLFRPAAMRPGADAAPRAVGVMGFENLSDPGDPERLGRILAALITTDLAETGGLRVVASSKILSSLRRSGQAPGAAFEASLAPEAARDAGVDVMLVGQVNRQGDGLMLTAEVVDVESGDTLGSLREKAASSEELFDLAGSLARKLRQRLGITPAGGTSPSFDLARSLTRSTQAYRSYAAGELALHQGLFDAAAKEFRKATDEDPTFALAWYRLSMAHGWMGDQDTALETARRGLDHVERLPVRWQRLYQAYLAFLEGDRDTTAAILRDLLAVTTDIPDAYNLEGELLTHSSRYWDPPRARRSLARALDIDPTFRVASFHLLDYDILAGELDRARRLLERLRDSEPDRSTTAIGEIALLLAEGRDEEAATWLPEAASSSSVLHHWAEITVLRRSGRYEEARRAVDRAMGEVKGHIRATLFLMRGVLALEQGRFDPALEDLRTAAEEMTASDPRSDLIDRTAQYAVYRARVLFLLGDLDQAEAEARRAVSLSPYLGEARYWLTALMSQARPEAAARVRTEFDAMAAGSHSPALVFWKEMLGAEEALAAGHLEGAAAHLGKIDAMPRGYRADPAESWLRARLLEASGDPGGALEAYNLVRETHFQKDDLGRDLEIMALYRKGLLQERLGRGEDARQSYRAFLAHWGDADRPLDEVADARRRLARPALSR